ncbi:MAG: phosphatidyl-myo-inositol dimannoside synthase [Actinomycetota bacterium]|nr:phosphatidyl-myo-inositol dimannoside synthase [Actinomycetota bacterium]
MTRTLVVTNDFPPRAGGIQAFVHALTARLDDVVVYAPAWEGAAAFDAVQEFPVVRHPTTLMVPGPTVAKRAAALIREHDCRAVWFGAAAPLGLLAPQLRRAGANRIVATTHGHEAGWAQLPVTRQLLRRIADGVDVLTYLGDYTRDRLVRAVSPSAASRLARLAPGVDTGFFRPGAGGDMVRDRFGLRDRPVIVCVSRLVPRKGQDVLIRALPTIRRSVPDVALLVVGDGPYRRRLESLVDSHGVRGAVTFSGPVPWSDLPAHYDAGDVFAMPCRTRRRGLDVEGLGIVYLEASATGLPVVAGRSGGAPDAVLPGKTGEVVDGTDVSAVAAAIVRLLEDPAHATAMGLAGRAWVERDWTWEVAANRLAGLLTG